MTLFIHRTVLSLGFRFIGAVAAVVVLDVARAATQVKTPGTQPITNPAVPAPIRMGLAQEWIFVPLPAGVEPLASSEQGHVVLLRSNPWNYVRWESGLEFRLKPDRNIGAYTEAAQATESNMKTIIYAVSKNGSIALNYQLFDGGLSRPGKIEEFTLVWAPGSFSPRPVLGDFMPIDNTNNWSDIGQPIWNSRRPGRMITLDGEDYLWGYFAYRLSPTAPLREYPFRVNPNTEQIGQATLVAPDIQVMAVSRGAAHSVGVRFVEVSQDNGTVVRQPVAGTLDNAPLSFLPIYVNDNGVVLGAANLNQWNDPYVAATLVYSVQKGIRPLPVGGRVTWIDEQDCLHGFDAPTGGNPVMWVVKTAPDGSPLPQLEYVKVPYVPMPNPANWVTDHLIPPGTRMPQLGKMTNSTTGQRRPFIAVRGGAPVDSNRDGQIVVGGSPSADASNPTGPYFLPVNNKAGDGTPNWDDSRVNGANDLKNFYPVFLDIKALVRALPPSAKIKYRLKHADGAINYVLTDLTAATAFDFRQDPRPTGYGLLLKQPAFFAQTTHATWSGSDLFDPAASHPMFLNRILNHDGGVILIEARGPTDKPLVLSVEQYDSTLGTVVLTEIKLPLLTAGLSLAVDASRDGTIKVASEDDSDATSANGPYRFWLNDDDDALVNYTWSTTADNLLPPGYLSPGVIIPPITTETEEDDKNVTNPQQEDWRDNIIDTPRDLEDFARLHLSIAGLQDAFKSGQLYLGLKWADTNGTSPAIKLYRATDTAGSTSYLFNPSAASSQFLQAAIIDARYPGYNLGQGSFASDHTLIGGADVFIIPTAQLGALSATTSTIPFIFEGCTAGKGQLKLVILKKDGTTYTEIGEGPGVWLEIKKPNVYVERFSCGDNHLGNVVAVSRLGTSATFAAPTTDEEKDYVLYVHGYNMADFEKQRWLETAYKRLWHLGYKGRVGGFSWPCAQSAPPFDASEEKAWQSAVQLKTHLANLKAQGYRVHVVAHSQGNVVVGEALRQAGKDSGLVRTYIASQAAVAASCYKENVPPMPNPGQETPDVYGTYPPTSLPYFDGSAMSGAASRFVNFYNPSDFALTSVSGNGFSWETNQRWKPDQGWGYNIVDGFFESNTSGGLTARTLPNDRFRIFSYGAEAKSLALGALPTGGVFTSFTNLQTTQQYGPEHIYHSGQFRASLATRYRYWQGVMTAADLTPYNP